MRISVFLEVTQADKEANLTQILESILGLPHDLKIYSNDRFKENVSNPTVTDRLVILNEKGADTLTALNHIHETMHPDLIMRIKSNGLKFSGTLFSKFIDSHNSQHADYSYTDTNSALFYGTILEILNPPLLKTIGLLDYPVLPDGTLNCFEHFNSNVYYFDYEDMSFFYIDHDTEYYPNPCHINIEVTPNCNLHCSMCYYHSFDTGVGITDQAPGRMDFEVYQKIIDEAATFKRKPAIDLYLRGEPLMNPDFVKYLQYAKSKELEVYTTTNATLLTKQMAHQLIENELNQITFSLDGSDKATFERIRQGADYNKVMDNINRFLELNQASGKNGNRTSTYVKTVIQEENKTDIDKLIRHWVPKIDFVAIQFQGVGHTMEESAHTIEDMYRLPWRMPCICHMITYTITSSGKAYTCGVHLMGSKPKSIGNLNDTTIMELWNKGASERAHSSRGEFTELPFCNHKCRLPINIVTNNKRIYDTGIYEITMAYNKVYQKFDSQQLRKTRENVTNENLTG